MQWYYLLQGQRQGPVDDAALDSLVRQGIVHDETLVWREGLTEWYPYGAVKPKPPAASTRPQTIPPRTEAPLRPEPVPGWPEALPYSGTFVPTSSVASSAAALSPAPVSPAPVSPDLPPRPAAERTGGANRAFFFYPVLDALADGRILREGVALCLKIAAILFAVGGLLGALDVLLGAFHGTTGAALGGILFALIVLGTAACVAQICWYRARTAAKVEPASGYTVIPLFAMLSRAAGETAAMSAGGAGLGACLFFWLSPEGAEGALQGVPFLAQAPAAEGGFLTGLIVLVYLAALGFLALILGYLAAECTMLLADIERNTRKNV